MKKLILASAIIASFVTSCQSDSKKYTTVDSTIMSEQQRDYKIPDECFTYDDKKGSTGKLLIYGTGADRVLGQLSYSVDGKDKNSGDFYGYMKGDTIIVDYKFQSEGVYSHREVAWVRKGDQLLEGYGATKDVNGDVKFQDVKKLTFGKSIIFDKTDCK
ncbi:hypothetical protein [Pedobacter sp. Leaf176]|uniref:hypothetical protein n=1 Tax=Pedobacter sp. Leaf176 TaxID=1736286 RepID=UPI0006F33A7B|nr:hypothetical protein [Pedobacter sp. Leaf176]KQR68144.1 hypothetical protein ASF92_14830 [Pedobacter sp. Leaf176]